MHGPPDYYEPVITSYDYGSPISESGETGQPGLGGPNSFEVCHHVLQPSVKSHRTDISLSHYPKRQGASCRRATCMLRSLHSLCMVVVICSCCGQLSPSTLAMRHC